MSYTNYASKPDKAPMTEQQKRWLSWNLLVSRGQKQSFSGVDITPEAAAKKKAKRAASKKSRKINRKK